MVWNDLIRGDQMVDLGSALLLLTCFAIVAQRRLSACVDLFALQSVFLALTAALVAFLTGIQGGDLAQGAAVSLFFFPVLAGLAAVVLRLAKKAVVT